MKKKKFLTVYACFDEKTQQILTSWQEEITCSYEGTQTMGIPFHISLGSFPVESKDQLMNLLKNIDKDFSSFEITLKKINTFHNQVLFLEPSKNIFISKLHEIFEGNYSDGNEYYPHATIFCGKEDVVLEAKKILEKRFTTFTATITEIQIGEFFPPKILVKKKLN